MGDQEGLAQSLSERILELDGVSQGKSRFGGGRAFFYNGKKEFCHFHHAGEVDVRIGLKEISKLKDMIEGTDRFHHRSKSSQWLEIQFDRQEELEQVLEFVEVAYKAVLG